MVAFFTTTSGRLPILMISINTILGQRPQYPTITQAILDSQITSGLANAPLKLNTAKRQRTVAEAASQSPRTYNDGMAAITSLLADLVLPIIPTRGMFRTY